MNKNFEVIVIKIVIFSCLKSIIFIKYAKFAILYFISNI